MDNIKEPALEDWVNTGALIRAEMERYDLDYVSLAKQVNEGGYHTTVTRQYLSNICKGKSFPSLYLLRVLADIFQCDTAYLLCEQDCRRHEATDIRAYTGLSEQSIETLHKLIMETDKKKKATVQHFIPFLNQLLEDQAAVLHVGANLNEISFANEYERDFGTTGTPDKIAFRTRNAGIYDLSRTIEQQADKLLGNPYANLDA